MFLFFLLLFSFGSLYSQSFVSCMQKNDVTGEVLNDTVNLYYSDDWEQYNEGNALQYDRNLNRVYKYFNVDNGRNRVVYEVLPRYKETELGTVYNCFDKVLNLYCEIEILYDYSCIIITKYNSKRKPVIIMRYFIGS